MDINKNLDVNAKNLIQSMINFIEENLSKKENINLFDIYEPAALELKGYPELMTTNDVKNEIETLKIQKKYEINNLVAKKRRLKGLYIEDLTLCDMKKKSLEEKKLVSTFRVDWQIEENEYRSAWNKCTGYFSKEFDLDREISNVKEFYSNAINSVKNDIKKTDKYIFYYKVQSALNEIASWTLDERVEYLEMQVFINRLRNVKKYSDLFSINNDINELINHKVDQENTGRLYLPIHIDSGCNTTQYQKNKSRFDFIDEENMAYHDEDYCHDYTDTYTYGICFAGELTSNARSYGENTDK